MLKVSIREKHNFEICFDQQISNMNFLIFQVRPICFEQLQMFMNTYNIHFISSTIRGIVSN